MPKVPMAPLYTTPDLKMEIGVFQKGYEPGRATLETLRSFSAVEEAKLGARINAEAQARETADNAEIAARTYADMQEGQARVAADTQERSERQAADIAEGKARSDGDATLSQRVSYLEAAAIADERAIAALQAGASAEVKARGDADAALQAQINLLKAIVVPLTGSLVLPAGITILVGKSTRTVAVAGLKKNDNLVVTPNAALPANLSMGEAYCLTDGTLTVVLVNSATLGLSITTAQTIPLGIIALRPQT